MANTEKIIFLTRDIQASNGHMLMNDQRTSQRLNHETPLVIENCDSGTYSYGRMYNYSQGGIYFESDTPIQTGTRVRLEIEKSKIGLDADHYFAEVKWCAEITAAVVLYDYGIGAEFDSKTNPITGNGKLKVIKGGVKRNTT
jgi:hypothetical protein